MWQKAWKMARTEIPMVFKNRMVQSIPILLIIMSLVMGSVIMWFILSIGIPDPFIFSLTTSLSLGVTIIAMPVILPVMIAADSIVGEKERHTLIPLLATPLTDTELLLGKFLTALIPGVGVAYANLILSVALVNGMVFFLDPTMLWVWPDFLSLLQAIIFPVLYSALAIGIMVIISGRVSKVYEAYQMGGVIILPAMLFAYSPLLSGTGFDWLIFFAGTIILIITDIGLFRLALNLFDRDKLVTRL